MKDEQYIKGMLQRAEIKKRTALQKEDENKFIAYNYIIRQLKIILEVDKTTTRKHRLKKTIEYNNNLI